MDGLTVASSIAGLVSLADTVVRRLVKYVQGPRDAKEDISVLLVGISNVLGILRTLELLAQQYGNEEVSYTQTY